MTFSGDINQDILKNTAIPADLILGTSEICSELNILGIARSNARQLESTKSGLRR